LSSEIRLLTQEDLPAYAALSAYAYNTTSAGVLRWLEVPPGNHMLGLFSGGRLAAALLDLRFEVWLWGRPVRASGVSALASAPETRRTGLVRELVAGYLERLREDGVRLSLLYPFKYAFYDRLGWSLAAQRVELKVPPAEFAAYGQRVGRVRQLLHGEKGSLQPQGGETLESVIAILDRIYTAEAVHFNLTARRTAEHWRHFVLEVHDGRRFVFAWEDDSGEVQGYFVARVPTDQDLAPMTVREIFAREPEGWRGLCHFLSCHDSQSKHIVLGPPVGSPLLDLLGNPRLEEAKVSPGIMARVVDVKGLLEARGTPGGEASGTTLQGSCVIGVRDELVSWNAGTFVVSCDGRTVKVERAEGMGGQAQLGRAGKEPDLDIGVGILSRVAVGARSLADALKFGLATGRPGPGLDFAQRFFPAAPVWHPEFY
jgi:predicted acetyltransferase